jgi:hypothetical protein
MGQPDLAISLESRILTNWPLILLAAIDHRAKFFAALVSELRNAPNKDSKVSG